MHAPFNLLAESWIPVALDDGQRVFIRPSEISQPYNGHAIIRIATGRPDCDMALTEFLIGLLAVTMDGTSVREWPARYREPPSRKELETAFSPLAPAMKLDGDGPRFFQDLEDLEGDQWSIEKLLIDCTSEHFQKLGTCSTLSRAGAAIAILTFQTYAPEGGRGHVTSLRGGGPITCLVVPPQERRGRSQTLWQLLWANAPNNYRIKDGDVGTVFPWLEPTRRNDQGIKTTPEDVHRAQAFFGLPRRIRLQFERNECDKQCDLLDIRDDVTVTRFAIRPGGTKYEAWGPNHPLTPCFKRNANDPNLSHSHLNSSRIGYSDWTSFTFLDDKNGLLPAQSVSNFNDRAANLQSRMPCFANIRLSAYVMKKNKPLDFAEALMPLILTGSERGNALVADMARTLVGAADLVAGQLVHAVRLALYGPKGDAKHDSTVLQPVQNRFWGSTEQDFYNRLHKYAETIVTEDGDLIDELDAPQLEHGEAWRRTLRDAALKIFDETVPINDAASDRIKDVVAGRRNLGMMLSGYGSSGKKLYGILRLPPPHTPKAPKSEAA